MDVIGATLTEVVPGKLWWGGALGAWWARTTGPAFDVVLACEAQVPEPPPAADQLVIRWGIPDAPALPDLSLATPLAGLCAVRMGLGERVLIHCVQGMNRSALLTGLTLRAWDGSWGTALVARLQALRPGSLYNDTFRTYLAGG